MRTIHKPRRVVSKAARAVRGLIVALGGSFAGELKDTPQRVAHLWADYLLSGQGLDARQLFGRGTASRSRGPVTLVDIGVHLVCPHHLTIAFGTTHLAYLPHGRIASFGALARLVRTCTARFVLQEEAAQEVADIIVDNLDAGAAAVVIDAVHPCHNVPHGRSHRAHAVTWGLAGDTAQAAQLRRLLTPLAHNCRCR